MPKPRRVTEPLTTDEIKYQEAWWTKLAQGEASSSKHFQADKLQLNLQPNDNGILECRGRMVGVYPTDLPEGNVFTHKFVQRAHLPTLHGSYTHNDQGSENPLGPSPEKDSQEGH